MATETPLTAQMRTAYARHEWLAGRHEALPNANDVKNILADLKDLLFPCLVNRVETTTESLLSRLEMVRLRLTSQVHAALMNSADPTDAASEARRLTNAFLDVLPAVVDVLVHDVQAAFSGDPAAVSPLEVMFCYPGVEALRIYRVAHQLHLLGVPLLPRLMAEHAHATTGIDIHPGAHIGKSFFIDHGTGVVIGETCIIGDNVKLYQGVTLGSMSFPKDTDGKLIRGRKRHPTLQDNVVVYANASILGGDTVIGHDSVVGSSVWLNHSVAPFTVVTLEKPLLRFRDQTTEFAPSYSI